METTFYDDNNLNSKKIKTNMTLDLSTMNKLKQDRFNEFLPTPDMGLFMISTPELERLFVHNNSGNGVLTTPTPTGQMLFPKMVTEEQEAYARGFIDALGKLHGNNSISNNNKSQLQQHHQLNNNDSMSPVVSTTTTSAFTPTTYSNLLAYTDYDAPLESGDGLYNSEPLNMKTVNPAAIDSIFDLSVNGNVTSLNSNNNYNNNDGNYSNSNVIINNYNNAASMKNSFQTNFKSTTNQYYSTASTTTTTIPNNNKQMLQNTIAQKLLQKETYHTVPHSPSLNSNNNRSSPPSSSSSSPKRHNPSPNQISNNNAIIPVNMDSQEEEKLERKRARNRIAATRCRNRKLERISRLEERVKELKDQNLNLAQTASLLREQVFKLKQTIVEHTQRGCQVMLSAKIFDSNVLFS